jgi:hypothetical protein
MLTEGRPPAIGAVPFIAQPVVRRAILNTIHRILSIAILLTARDMCPSL